MSPPTERPISKIERDYRKAIALYPDLNDSLLQRDNLKISQVLPNDEAIHQFNSAGISTSHRLEVSILCRLLIPIDLLCIHPKQRPLNPAQVEEIYVSFGANPAFLMSGETGVAVIDKPARFPSLVRNFDRRTIYRLRDLSTTFSVISGNHRLHALKRFANDNNIPHGNVFWPFEIIHPRA